MAIAATATGYHKAPWQRLRIYAGDAVKQPGFWARPLSSVQDAAARGGIENLPVLECNLSSALGNPQCQRIAEAQSKVFSQRLLHSWHTRHRGVLMPGL